MQDIKKVLKGLFTVFALISLAVLYLQYSGQIFDWAYEHPIISVSVLVGCAWFLYRDLKKDSEEAERRQRNANIRNELAGRANGHEPEAMFALGMMMLEDTGPEADITTGMSWIRAAALKHEPRACLKMGYAYLNGDHECPISNATALAFFEDAARQGDDEAKTIARNLRISEVRRKKINVSESEWQEFAEFFERCGSYPETVLLESLILAADLKPNRDDLRGKIVLMPQAKVLNYRVDFLVNEKLVVEVDGESYHSDPKAFEADRFRDQELILNGYQPIRFTAKQILRDSVTVASSIIEVSNMLSFGHSWSEVNEAII